MTVTKEEKVVHGADLVVIGNGIKNALARKQDTLVSGTNIKTINNTSLLGSGDIVIPKGDKGEPGADISSAIIAWNGTSVPAVADIPAGVVITYSGTSYTGTLSASAITAGKMYLVANEDGEFDRYVVTNDGGYAWAHIGSTKIHFGIITEEDGFFFVDEEYNVSVKYDTSGLDAALLSQHFLTLIKNSILAPTMSAFIEVEEDGFFFVDPSFRIGAIINKDNQFSNLMYR